MQLEICFATPDSNHQFHPTDNGSAQIATAIKTSGNRQQQKWPIKPAMQAAFAPIYQVTANNTDHHRGPTRNLPAMEVLSWTWLTLPRNDVVKSAPARGEEQRMLELKSPYTVEYSTPRRSVKHPAKVFLFPGLPPRKLPPKASFKT